MKSDPPREDPRRQSPPQPAASLLGRLLRWTLRLALAAAIFWVIAARVDRTVFLAAFRRVSPAGFLAATLVYLTCFPVWAWRYGTLLGGYGLVSRPLWRLRAVLEGNAASVLLPSGLSGDVLRYLAARRLGLPRLPVALVLLMEKLLTLWAWCLLPLLVAGFCWRDALVRSSGLFFLALSAAGALAFLGWPLLTRLIRRLLATARLAGLRDKFEQVGAAVVHLREQRRRLLAVLLQSLLFGGLISAAAWLFGLCLGLHVHPVHYVLMIALVYVANTIPLTPGGIGVREGIFVAYLGHLGLSRELGLAYGVLILGAILAGVAVGGVLIAIGGEKA
jgi:hypothetical protein